ncbi:MAG: alkaline phosphatase family protein [Candidatus Binatus sp.]|uniref:alkaline phosphatase family protein n=1 Tax=Candidatus Binatus sp. TaxID=2811406 RepID=UPI002716D341|nr:alkaline phosphatase family protein [Candidatus Binatus sp.]MDO8431366.1 alkaline phosphatase family protein [Candidatus Binatus sp.]
MGRSQGAHHDMTREYGPERRGGQGLDSHQYESGDRTIVALLRETIAAEQIDLVATWRADAYEVWSRRGMIRFKRFAGENGALSFKIVEQIGENPIANQDPFVVATIEEELAAARASGNPDDDANRAYFEPHALSHPYAYERIAQLFDSPRAPDLVVSPKSYAYGIQPGQHGSLDVVQCRAPLVFAGPGVRRGEFQLSARHVDIAPTIASVMRFPAIAGLNATGAGAQVYLKRQDGDPLSEIIDEHSEPPARVYMILLDGLSHTELRYQLEQNRTAIPHIAGLIERGAMLSHGSIVNFPSITWPSHSTIMTGAWCGHHDVVNPTFHLREHRETVPIQGNIFEMERYLNHEVETLYEAFKRVRGASAITASIHEPQCRGADHAVFERRIIGDKARLKALTQAMSNDISPRWMADDLPDMRREEVVDIRGMAQLINLFDHCADEAPVFVAHEFVLTDGAGHDYGPHHEGLREALYRTDQRIGAVLEIFRRRGLLESTLFVVTSDHGMAAQRIELKANPACEPARVGIQGVFAEPMIYLRDLRVEVERARDLRSVSVTVFDNDHMPDGEHPPLAGARVILYGRGGAMLAEVSTPDSGRVAFATPADASDAEMSLKIEHPTFNRRTLTLDGSPIAPDIRKILYGDLAKF